MKKEFVVLVSGSGRRIGVAEKLEAHKKGLLHRAFSIFIFNDRGEMLLQKRSLGKYHFAGLWSNACCSHPRPGERILSAAKRRLKEEMGIKCSLKNSGYLTYQANDKKSGLIENELDYIFFGDYGGKIHFDKKEVAAVRWISISLLNNELRKNPEKFTPWFKQIYVDTKPVYR